MRLARADAIDAAAAFVVLLVGGVSAAPFFHLYELGDLAAKLAITLILAAAAGAHRRLPGVALALIWVALGMHIGFGESFVPADAAVAIVGYGTARYGSTGTLVASAVSIPAAGFVVALPGLIYMLGWSTSYQDYGSRLLISSWVGGSGIGSATYGAIAFVGLLLAPWLVGLVLRLADRNRRTAQRAEQAEVAAEQSAELARVRDEQARLARDVHDVVGHSLAVILAQAESGQYVDDTARLQATLADIAGAARGSLRDVRGILRRTTDSGSPAGSAGHEPTVEVVGDLDELIEDVRSAGVVEVEASVEGVARPLPPEQATVAYRVLQEALTNAIKHGRPDAPISARRVWDHGLTIEVTNATRADAAEPDPDGHGLVNMRRRLESVGGTLAVARVPGRHTVLAWLPAAAPPLAGESPS